MNYNGTPGRVQVIPVDPNNRRIDIQTLSPNPAGHYNDVTVNQYGQITSGQFIPPTTGGGGTGGGTGGSTGGGGTLGGTSITVVANGTTIMSNAASLILINGVNITFTGSTTHLTIDAPTNLRITDAGLDQATIDQLASTTAMNGAQEIEVYDPALSPTSRKITGFQLASFVQSVNGTIPNHIRVTDAGSATNTIDQLTASGSTSLNMEFEVYNPATNPHSVKISGSQVVSMVESVIGGTIPMDIRVTDTGNATRNIDQLGLVVTMYGSQEFEIYNPASVPHSQKATVTQVQNFIEYARKNSLCYISFGRGQGGDATFDIGQVGTENDGRCYFSNLSYYAKTDPGNNYHGDTTGTGDTDYYACPYTGWYQFVTKLRITDGTVFSTSQGAGQGAGKPGELAVGDHDFPDFYWFNVGDNPAYRNSTVTIRIVHCSAGDHLSLVTMTDAAATASDGAMAVNLLSID